MGLTYKSRSDVSRRLILYAVGAVVVLIAVLSVLSFLSDPFGIRSWFRDREQARVETLETDLSARTRESEGRAEQVQRIETYHREVVTIQSATASQVSEARSAPDASTPLDPARVDRLRAADRVLCNLAAGCSSPVDNPAG